MKCSYLGFPAVDPFLVYPWFRRVRCLPGLCLTPLQCPSQVSVVMSPQKPGFFHLEGPIIWLQSLHECLQLFQQTRYNPWSLIFIVYQTPVSPAVFLSFLPNFKKKKNGLLWVLPIYSLSGGKNPSVSSCSIYIWNTQPYLSLANSFFSVRSFCLEHYLFFLHQRDHLFQPLHSALHSSAFQQQEAVVPMQNLFYPHGFFPSCKRRSCRFKFMCSTHTYV